MPIAPLLLVLLTLAPGLAARPQEVARRAVDPTTGHTYLRTDESLSAYDAEALARILGGTLVAIASAQEETFLLENFGASELYWIGLEYPRRTWATGETQEFSHWAPGEPSGTPLEPFTLMNWGEPGAWADVGGEVESQRYRALIELPQGVVAESIPTLPVRRLPQRGVLLCVIQGLTQRDLENSRNANLNQFWKASAWSADAGADGSGDPLASLGMCLWGVGSTRSRLSSSAPQNAARKATLNLLSRLESAHPSITTAALLDDAALAGILLDGRVDVRVSNASLRRGGSEEGMQDALSRATPLCVVVTWTTPDITGGEPLSEAQRAKDIAAIDRELGVLLATLRTRAGFAAEEWWIALCGLAPVSSNPVSSKKVRGEELRARTAVPLAMLGSRFAPGELLQDIGLVDLVPSALLHLGIEPRASFALDGLALGHPVELGRNLIANGDAEAQFDWSPHAFPWITGWRQLASFRLARHGADATVPPEPGHSYYQGAASPLARMEQTIDLGALTGDIERGALRYRLAGWLGTERETEASIELALEFLNERKKTLERVVLGPLGANEKRPKGEASLGPRELSADGRVPRRTRAARLILSAEGERGVERTFADQLSLILERE